MQYQQYVIGGFRWEKNITRTQTRLLIHADGGGSNGSRDIFWKNELQKLKTEIGHEITIYYFPPGTNKWNKTEHRLFSRISKNLKGRLLKEYTIIVNLIASTKAKTQLELKAELDTKEYKTGIKISKKNRKCKSSKT